MSLPDRVVNTAPLIFLSKLGRLDLLRMGAGIVYVPGAVLNELSVQPDEAHRSIQSLLGSWLVEKNCTRPDLLAIISQAVDPGEAEVIALAIELGIQDVVLDDLDARRFAYRSGLQPIGTLGLLLAAKANGLLSAIRPEIESLRRAGFRASETLVERILAEAGE